MARDLYLEVLGADTLQRLLDHEVPAAFEAKALKDANKKAAEIVVRLALPNVPVRSGRLRASVRAQSSAKKGNVRAGTPSRVPYAAAIHWGRSTGAVGYKHGHYAKSAHPLEGRPFLWNAKNDALESGELEDAYAQACNNVVRQFF